MTSRTLDHELREFFPPIPNHWSLERFKSLFIESSKRNGPTPVGEMLSVSGYTGVSIKAYRSDDQKRTVEELSEYRVVNIGQLVVNTMWLNFAGLGVSPVSGYVSPAYRVYEVSPTMGAQYAHHLLRSSVYVEIYKKHMQGIRPNSLQVKSDDFSNLPVLIPPRSEQAVIGNFLDRETKQIDTLIDKQKKLIQLLKEKRQAVISQAVDLAKAQTSTSLGYLADIVPGFAFQSSTFSSSPKGPRLLRGTNVAVGRTRWNDIVYYDGPTIKPEFVLKTGDVVLGMDRPWIAGGTRVAEITQEDAGSYLVQRVACLRGRRGTVGKFLRLCLESDRFSEEISLEATGVSVPHISPSQISAFRVPLLDIASQSAAVDRVDSLCKKLDFAAIHAATAISLLRERRAALITAAVTGQIDVSNYPPPSEPAPT